MSARIRKLTLSDEWKKKIGAGVILAKLMKHINGDVEMSSTQIKAADILLKKVIPDLARTEHTDPDGGPMRVLHTYDQEVINRYQQKLLEKK